MFIGSFLTSHPDTYRDGRVLFFTGFKLSSTAMVENSGLDFKLYGNRIKLRFIARGTCNMFIVTNI